MKSLTLTMFLLIAAVTVGSAQVGGNTSIYSKSKVFCSIDVPVRGQAKEDKKIFINPTKGSYAYIIVDNYPNKFPVQSIKLTSYKKSGGEYKKIDAVNYDIDNQYTYTYIKYSFLTAGDYAFDVHDSNGDFINSAYVTAEYDEPTTTTKTSSGGSSNYSKARSFISIEVPVAGIATESKSILISRKGSYAYIVVDNYPNDFNVDGIKLKAYKKVSGEYKKVEEKEYDIKSDSYYTYIKYSFFDNGDYAFDIYDENDVFIATAYVTVKYK